MLTLLVSNEFKNVCSMQKFNDKSFTGLDIHNIVIVPSELPSAILSELPLPTEVNLTVSVFDPMRVRFDTSLPVQFSKCVTVAY